MPPKNRRRIAGDSEFYSARSGDAKAVAPSDRVTRSAAHVSAPSTPSVPSPIVAPLHDGRQPAAAPSGVVKERRPRRGAPRVNLRRQLTTSEPLTSSETADSDRPAPPENTFGNTFENTSASEHPAVSSETIPAKGEKNTASENLVPSSEKHPIKVEEDSASETEPDMKVTKKSGPAGTEGGTKHVCDICSLDITNTVYVRCAEAICGEYELCVNCFKDPKKHRDHDPATHSFRIIEPNARPIFTEDWGADEELRVIEGAEKYGMGSWAEIAAHVGGYRTKEEVEKHYNDIYINSKHFPLPERADARDMKLTESISKEEFQAQRKSRIAAAKEAHEKAAAASSGPKQKPTASVPACHEIQGYMPGRLEFETEYANEAEEVVQGMSFEPGDGINPVTGELEPENALKHDVLAIYNDKLDQRAERKRVIFEHELLDYRKKIAIEKKLPKDERDIVNRCKPLCQLMNKEEYEEFVASQRKILGLRTAIAQLQDWRNMGVTSLQDGEAYEKAKAERAARQAHAQAGQFDRLPSAGRPKPQQVVEQPSLAQTLVAPKLPPTIERVLDGGSSIPAKEFVESHEQIASGLQAMGLIPADIDNQPPPVDSGYRCQPIKDLVPWDMGPDVPDINHLLKEEISLCNVCHIRPKPYFVIKSHIMLEAMRQGGQMKKKETKALFPKLDPQKVNRIHDFFVRAGWIGKG